MTVAKQRHGEAERKRQVSITLAGNAKAPPLPALIEMTDLGRETLDALTGRKAPSSLPNGLVRVAAVLTE